MTQSGGPVPSVGNNTRIVVCAACKKDSHYGPQNQFRPFCSERCKNHDFGAWASEAFRMPTESTPDDQIFSDAKYQ